MGALRGRSSFQFKLHANQPRGGHGVPPLQLLGLFLGLQSPNPHAATPEIFHFLNSFANA